MEYYLGQDEIPETINSGVLVIGNFDGVHLGHQALIAHAKEIAGTKNMPLSVMDFEPHPRRFFTPDTESFRITSPETKRCILEKQGVDHMVTLDFNQELVSLSAQDFIEEILLKRLIVKHIVVGDEFAFGKGREGNTDILIKAGKEYGFDVDIFSCIGFGADQKYSSTQVRECIRHGEIKEANDILGWEWILESEVIHGDKRGREFGFPTANQKLGDYIHPAYGVYAVRVSLVEKGQKTCSWLKGVANIGVRPMFKIPEPLIESYIFDFDEEIYGQNLRIQPVAFLRPEQNFENIDKLKEQINLDCLQASSILK